MACLRHATFSRLSSRLLAAILFCALVINLPVAAAGGEANGGGYPRKPYADSQAVLPAPFVLLNGNSTGTSRTGVTAALFERQQYNLLCETETGEEFYCQYECCDGEVLEGCCYAGDTCIIEYGEHKCCPSDQGYVTCGGFTCIDGVCCDDQGRACAGSSICCSDGGCCDTGTTCCGNLCCYEERECCDGICCDQDYYCSSARTCEPINTPTPTEASNECVKASSWTSLVVALPAIVIYVTNNWRC